MVAIAGVRNAVLSVGIRGLPLAFAQQVGGRRSGIMRSARELLQGACVLEVGGPSRLFAPESASRAYALARSVDNVNFAGATLWEKNLVDGGPFPLSGPRLGTQYLREAGALGDIGPYDGVISSHVLEHLANPMGALREWHRVTRDTGFLLLVFPHRDATFDHRRPVTSLEHLRADAEANMPEEDATHMDEILRLHDLGRDRGTASRDQLIDRMHNNASTRAMHHHVFTTRSAVQLVAESGWSPVQAEAIWPMNIHIIARKSTAVGHLTVRSPFPSDRP